MIVITSLSYFWGLPKSTFPKPGEVLSLGAGTCAGLAPGPRGSRSAETTFCAPETYAESDPVPCRLRHRFGISRKSESLLQNLTYRYLLHRRFILLRLWASGLAAWSGIDDYGASCRGRDICHGIDDRN